MKTCIQVVKAFLVVGVISQCVHAAAEKYPLIEAAKNKDIERLAELLGGEQGIDVDTQNTNGATALYWAARNGWSDGVEFLCEQGADVTLATKDKLWTPLHAAARYGRAKVAGFLCSHESIDVDAQDKHGYTPLILAVKQGNKNKDVVEVLLQVEADQDLEDEEGKIALVWARENGSEVLIGLLEGHNSGHGGLDCFEHSCSEDEFSSDSEGEENPESAYSLEKNNGAPRKKVNIMELKNAVEKGRLKQLQGLIHEHEWALGEKFDSGNTLLHLASQAGKCAVVEYFCEAEVDVNAQNVRKRTPLHLAAMKASKEVVEFLCSRCADVNVNSQDYRGETPLHIAARMDKCKEVVELLCQTTGIILDARDKFGRTPLHSAALFDVIANAETLIKSGAETGTLDIKGKSPWFLAVEQGAEKVAKYLSEKCGANTALKDSLGNGPKKKDAGVVSVIIPGKSNKPSYKRKKYGNFVANPWSYTNRFKS